MTSLEHPSISKVAASLREAGIPAAADGIWILDGEARTAARAAAVLGVPVGAIANSLVFRAISGQEELPILALTSGAHRADIERIAALVGAKHIGLADPGFVRKHTGQAIGGVAPIGHPRPIRTLVDNHLVHYEVVWAAAGHPRAVFPTTLTDLVAITGGTVCALQVAGGIDVHRQARGV
ncbi:MAG: YbaK/EbsC family protein [Micromonosporaceae bacterium]